ncbi:MAG: hypothetical protein U0821_11050 [Chloroflexota bacterium]
MTVSAVVRAAIARYCDEALREGNASRLSHILGQVESNGGQAERSGEAFKRILAARPPR